MTKAAAKSIRKPTQAVKSAEQVEVLERYLLERGQLYFDVWKFGANTALRISDILALTMDKVREVDQGDRSLQVREIKTQKINTITLNVHAMAVINRRLADNPNDVWLFESPQRRNGKDDQRAITRRQVARVLEAGGKELTPKLHLSTHSMRKSRGYALHKAGMHIAEIAKVLNHSSPATTMAYIGLDAEMVARSFDDVLV